MFGHDKIRNTTIIFYENTWEKILCENIKCPFTLDAFNCSSSALKLRTKRYHSEARVRKSDQKITSLELRRVEIGLKSCDQPKGTSRAPTKCTYLISISKPNLEGKYWRNSTQKGGKPNISPPN